MQSLRESPVLTIITESSSLSQMIISYMKLSNHLVVLNVSGTVLMLLDTPGVLYFTMGGGGACYSEPKTH